jgi:hypothetical protein
MSIMERKKKQKRVQVQYLFTRIITTITIRDSLATNGDGNIIEDVYLPKRTKPPDHLDSSSSMLPTFKSHRTSRKILPLLSRLVGRE